MNSDANPILTLVWTFGLMSLFAVGGANAAIPEMHRVAVDVQHWMTDKQFADVFAISQMSPGPNVLIVTLIGYSVAGVAGALAATLAMCVPTAVLAYYVSRLLARSSQSRWPAIIQAALVPLSIGLMGASGLILALTSDRTWAAALVTAASAVLAFATRLNPLWMLLAGGLFGFCWRYLTKIARQDRGGSINAIQTEWARSLAGEERSMSDTPSHGPVKSIMPKWVRGPQDFVGGIALMAIAIFALWASSDLQGMHGFSFGAGTAPRMFAVLLLGLGIAVMVVGLVTEGAASGDLRLAGPAVRLAVDPFVCRHDPPAGSGDFSLSHLHDFRAGNPRNPVEGNHHRRHLPDRVLQLPFSLRTGAADAALAPFPDSVRA